MKFAVRLLVLGLLVLGACSSRDRVHRALNELESALPPELRYIAEGGGNGALSARYEARGEPAGVAKLVRSSLIAKGFDLRDGPGLPDPWPGPPVAPGGPGPSNLGPPPNTEPRAVDAFQISGFRGRPDLGLMRSLSFHPAPTAGWALVVVVAALS